ncbi:Gpi16 subunit, GPI transamidase component [Piedraia hortae CBS 480.64]|uniref:Gpi16 subunit, GPI transamidase component n=1 Tax=Piedraia hortae CBS 480.64 TaxID=1314780 RepID=A0A6A7BZX9_9PEZI|nr:Gpi16 subunit, GPI transamidase component [Piedraia hortae CBS 480.64]
MKLPALVGGLLLGARAQYHEQLDLKPLANNFLYAGFNFSAATSLEAYEKGHFSLFPRSLGQILRHTHTQELHLRFALGRWDDQTWGERPRRGRREGGTGVELWAWVEDPLDENWTALVNGLSGLFCASLNFIKRTKTSAPLWAFERESVGDFAEADLLHGMLPREVVCTENLTPFVKLLPCHGKAGIGSLLDGHKVFDANWQTMSVRVRRVGETVEVEQTVDLVIDLERSARPDRIPTPPPLEEIQCDETKKYHQHDTCFPLKKTADVAYNLSSVFGRSIHGNCHLNPVDDDVTLELPDETKRFTLAEGDFDMEIPVKAKEEMPGFYASRQLTGYGQEKGRMHTTLYNFQPHEQRLVYLEPLPWFLRPYIHTLEVKGATVETTAYTPAVDRQRGTTLELVLLVPPLTNVSMTYDVEKAILRYTEYPPDANRGFDVPSAVVHLVPEGRYLRTTPLLLSLPTPDFSMPYNVIILTSTVIALGFGSVFNLLVRRLVLPEEVPRSQLKQRLQRFRK